jgi:peroxiredoxin
MTMLPAIHCLLAACLLAALACGPDTEGRAPAEVAPQAPDFTLSDLDGKSISLTALRGKTVVLDFWATWCPPCEFQIPILNDIYEAHQGEVEILGISVDTEGVDVVRAYIEKHRARYPILMGTEALARRFGAPGFPSLIVVDAAGRIAQIHVGLIEAPELEKAIAEVSGQDGDEPT